MASKQSQKPNSHYFSASWSGPTWECVCNVYDYFRLGVSKACFFSDRLVFDSLMLCCFFSKTSLYFLSFFGYFSMKPRDRYRVSYDFWHTPRFILAEHDHNWANQDDTSSKSKSELINGMACINCAPLIISFSFMHYFGWVSLFLSLLDYRRLWAACLWIINPVFV